MTKRHLPELIIDPSSGQLSASRLCALVMVLVYLPIMILMEARGVKITYWTQFAAMLGSVLGAYAANSTARVWKESYKSEGAVVGPPTKSPKPEGE